MDDPVNSTLNNVLNHCFFYKDYFTVFITVRLMVLIHVHASLYIRVNNSDTCI